jgi:phosphoglycerate dehydrogenase-like enzyme
MLSATLGRSVVPLKIVVPDDFPTVFTASAAERELRGIGALEVHTARGAEREAELARRIGDAEVVVTLRAYSRFTAGVLAACPKLQLISIWGTGTDNVDLEACRLRGIAVTNTPGVNAHAVAEHTVALMLAFARRIPEVDREMRAGAWPRQGPAQLEGKTVGLVGLGAIGARVAALLAPFGVRIIASTHGPDNGRSARAGARHVPIEELLRSADVVSLHWRLSVETARLIGRERLALMKPTAFLVNTARGGLLDRDALLDALRAGRIAGAALDVFHEEPLAADDPLRVMPNVILTPHNGGTSPEVIEQGLLAAVRNVAQFGAGSLRHFVVAPAAERS